jgi:hypothetical protein
VTQYFTDFTEYADTADLNTEWDSDVWDRTSLFVVDLQSTEGKDGGPAMRSRYTSSPGSFARTAIKWDGPVPDTADVEIVCRFRSNAGTSENNRIAALARGSGTTANGATGYLGPYFRGNIRIASYSGGSFATHATISGTLSSSTWYWMRFQLIGTALKVRRWADGDTEPGTWDIEVTNSRISAAGWVGLFHAGSGPSITYYDRFGVGTGGDAAPTTDPSSGTDVAPYGKQSLKQSYQPIAASRLNGVMQ